MDILLSIIGSIVLSPLFLIIALAIKVDSKGQILFKQKRIGKDKKIFDILKFRTMQINAPKDSPTHMLENPEMYITKVGKFLRKTSFDELPQICNIIIGNMSIIGPRPALWNQYDLINEREKYGANDVRPGLTGLAQINGRDELSIEEKAKFDGIYVDNLSLSLDTKIFLITVVKILRSDGFFEGATSNKHNNNSIPKKND
jgi:O-antigen biosynthesis protein WbqP